MRHQALGYTKLGRACAEVRASASAPARAQLDKERRDACDQDAKALLDDRPADWGLLWGVGAV
jgi:hypothetical protein